MAAPNGSSAKRNDNMNMFLKILFSLVLLGGLSSGNFSARADLEVSASVQINATADFNAPLAPYGGWVEVRSRRCWRPSHVEAGWRPYCNGEWVWTDCGWYFESDEPWAWACYHYGYWVDDDEYGWIWMPGVEWGPAWVTWREGDGYIGWAPMPPPGWVVTVAPAPWFVFVQERRFTERLRPSAVIVNRTEIINHTRVINNITREERDIGGARRRVVINDGPGVDPVQKAVGHSIKRTSIRDVASRAQVPAEVRHNEGARQKQEQPQSQPQPQPQTQPPPTERRNMTQPTTPAPSREPGKSTRERERAPMPTQPQTPVTPPAETEHHRSTVHPEQSVPPTTTPAPSDKPREAPEKPRERQVEPQPQRPMTPSHVPPVAPPQTAPGHVAPSAPPQTVRPEQPAHPDHPEQGRDKEKQP